MMDTGRWPLTAATVLEKEAWRESLTSLVGMRSIRRKEGLDCWKGKGNPYNHPPRASGARWHTLCRCPGELLPTGNPRHSHSHTLVS